MSVPQSKVLQKSIRKARVEDIPQMQQLIAHFAEAGLMLPRSEKSLYEHVQNFTVAEFDGKIVGTAGLHILWKDLAEIRSLAVDASVHGQGVGRGLVEQVKVEAKELGVGQLLSLTYQTVFFEKLGFFTVERDSLPHKVWKDCIFCKKFDNCDETAMIHYT